MKRKYFKFRGHTVCLLNKEDAQKADPKAVYGIRHGDSDWGIPITVEKTVVVNRWGFLYSKTPIKKLQDKNTCISLSEREQQLFLLKEPQ